MNQSISQNNIHNSVEKYDDGTLMVSLDFREISKIEEIELPLVTNDLESSLLPINLYFANRSTPYKIQVELGYNGYSVVDYSNIHSIFTVTLKPTQLVNTEKSKSDVDTVTDSNTVTDTEIISEDTDVNENYSIDNLREQQSGSEHEDSEEQSKNSDE